MSRRKLWSFLFVWVVGLASFSSAENHDRRGFDGPDHMCKTENIESIFGFDQNDIAGCATIWPEIRWVPDRKTGNIRRVSQISLKAFGQKIRLPVVPSRSILSDDFVFISRSKNNKNNDIISLRNAENSADNGRKSRQSINNNYDIFDGVQHQQPRQCFYHVAQNSHFKGSLNLCNGIHAVLTDLDHDITLVIQPRSDLIASRNQTETKPKIRLSLNSPHVVVKYRRKRARRRSRDGAFAKRLLKIMPEFHNSRALLDKFRQSNARKFELFPRSLHFSALKTFLTNLVHGRKEATRRLSKDDTSEITIEIAIFVDKDLFQTLKDTFPQDTEEQVVNVVTAMMDAVQILFEDGSLGSNIKLALKRIEIMRDDPDGLERSSDIQKFLDSFCQWQDGENSDNDADVLHWDHALLLTGLDLKSKRKKGKMSSKIVGLAPVSGMCDSATSCTVSEGSHFESVFVIAHELGHNLGMRHDGRSDLNECDPSAYLMSPTLGSGKNTWSTCSKRYLQEFLKEEICTDLHCTRDHYTWTSHSALEGTECGMGKWCRKGACSRKPKVSPSPIEDIRTKILKTRVDGGWSPWSSFGECSCKSGSSIRGFRVATRRCSNPRPKNGGRSCRGEAVKYQTCDAKQDCPSSIGTIVEETCRQASLTNVNVLPFGDAQDTDTCRIQCFKAGSIGGSISEGYSFPDGTRCGQSHGLCIKGQCQSFSCDGSRFQLNPAECVSQRRILRDSRWTPWKSQTGCSHPCILPGNGLKLVSRQCLKSSRSIIKGRSGVRTDDGTEDACLGLQHSVQLCHDKSSDFRCTSMPSPDLFANQICSEYKSNRLSGSGMQLKQIEQDPDRACKVSCQDSKIDYRYYVVSSKAGWFPSGTSCGQEGQNNAFCVMGKCLEFGTDLTPKYNMANDTLDKIKRIIVQPRSLRSLHSIQKRELLVETPQRIGGSIEQAYLEEIIQDINATHFHVGETDFESFNKDGPVIAFNDPIDIQETPSATFEAFRSARGVSSGSSNLTPSLLVLPFTILFRVLLI